ncbi:MAG: AAA family ATPase [Clostridiales bacterium]|nr:AAA family ATPase [Clostridiales bacterium]
MNNDERVLIRYVCDGDMRRAQMQARSILNTISSPKDAAFRDDMLRRMTRVPKGFMELPQGIKGLLAIEDSAAFPEEKFLIRKTEAEAAERTISLYRAAERLADIGIPYLPALMLYGESGCGKTELARYIAHRAELPFAYVRFSSLVDAHLGGTQSNIARIFEYVRSNPCVLCFDEIDAIGMTRGQAHELGEMNRVVIAVMQELDQAPNNAIIIGTTNRFDQLDPALVRRFPLRYELLPLSADETKAFARKFFQYAGLAPADQWVDGWCEKTFEGSAPAATVVRECTDVVVNHILREGTT